MSNTDILGRAYDAFASGDIPGVLATLDEKIEWTQPGAHVYAGTVTGPDAVLQKVITPLGTEWDSFRVEPDTFLSEGDQVAALGWLSGTYRTTGVAFRARFVYWWTTTEARATRFEAIEDTVQMALPAVAMQALEQHRDQAVSEAAERGTPLAPDGLVFTSTTGTPLEPRNVNRTFTELVKAAGLRHVPLHDLRHTCASLLLAQGVAPRVVMDTLGHSAIAVTMNTYGHVMPLMQRDAADRMNELLR